MTKFTVAARTTGYASYGDCPFDIIGFWFAAPAVFQRPSPAASPREH